MTGKNDAPTACGHAPLVQVPGRHHLLLHAKHPRVVGHLARVNPQGVMEAWTGGNTPAMFVSDFEVWGVGL